MGLHHLIYLSKMSVKDEAELQNILTKSVWNNERNSITGILLYAKGDVLQVLEGDEAVIHGLFNRIARDPRHTEIFTVIDEPIANRDFGQWSMGYRNLQSAKDLEQFSDYSVLFRNTPAELQARARPGAALQVMKSFSAWAVG